MHILITGGTGFIGRNLINHDLFSSASFTILTRDRNSSRDMISSRCKLVESLNDISKDQIFDAVINLAGAQIVGKRWSEKRKKQIIDSRVGLTRELVKWIGERDSPPATFLSGSAIGIYGDTGDQLIHEHSAVGADFGAKLCADWEAEAIKAEDFGTRVCLLRTGLVFGSGGGMLKQLMIPFRLYLGSQIGNGKQWMSWVHMQDEIRIIHHLLQHTRSSGPYNLVSPNPVDNRTFTKALATALGRVSIFIAPAFVIKAALGEASSLMLGGQKVSPSRIEEEGYAFTYPKIEDALSEVTSG